AQALFAFKAGAMNAVAGPGTAQHSYIHVEDVARAAIHLAERGQPGGGYNLAGRAPVATGDVYAPGREGLGGLSWRERPIRPRAGLRRLLRCDRPASLASPPAHRPPPPRPLSNSLARALHCMRHGPPEGAAWRSINPTFHPPSPLPS